MRLLLLVLVISLRTSLALGQVPIIQSISPVSGPAGTQVTINGHQFGANTGDNKVYFGTLPATVVSASPLSLTVTVPAGATTQPITVLVNGLSTYSAQSFITTYTAIGSTIGSNMFRPAINLSGGGDVSTADLDGDGYTDLFYTRFSFDEVRILHNTGNGFGFSYQESVWGGTTNPLGVKAADVNGDGLPELLVLSYMYDCVNIFKNNSTPGTINLQWPPVTLAATDGCRDFAIGDLDNDGKPDIVITNQNAHTISIFRNTSTGGNISFSTKIDLATTAGPEGVAIGDLDGDGKREIVVAGNSAMGGISLFRNQSTPGTLAFDAKQDLAAGSWPWDVEIADVDGDGKPDLLASNTSSSTISVFRNTSTGAISLANRVDLATGGSPRGMTVADINGDGKPELLTANWFIDATVAILGNKSSAGTIAFDPFVTYTTNTGCGEVVVADLNRDGAPDIVTANSQSNSLSYLHNIHQVNTGMPSCPTLTNPAHNSSIPHWTATRFIWRKDPYATGYQLSIKKGTSVVVDITTTDTSYEFTPTAGLSYTWSVRPSNAPNTNWTCPEFRFSACPVLANQTTISAEGPTSFCTTDSVKLQANYSGAYQWYRDGQPIDGADNFLWVKTAGSYTVRMTNGGCYSEPSNAIVVTTLQAPAKPVATAGGPTSFCAGGSVQLTGSIDNQLQWFRDDAPIDGATAQQYTATGGGSYFVRITNSASGCHNYSDKLVVTVTPVPPMPVISAVGSATACAGTQVQLQSTASTGNVWYKDNTPLGFGAQSAFVEQSGSYTVQVNPGGCASAISAPFLVTINPIPATPTVSTPNPTVCAGDSVALQSSAVAGNQWYRNNQLIDGATAPTYRAKVAGAYTVRQTSNGCASAVSASTTVSFLALPAKPAITVNSSALSVATTYTSYAWFLNNAPIIGANGAQHVASQSGLYRVVVTNLSSCAISSDELNFVYTATNDVEWQGYAITWFPNPVHDQLHLRVSPQTSLTGKVTVRITDNAGRPVIVQQPLKTGNNVLSMAGLAPGIYRITLRTGKQEKSFSILKAH
ncbi:FG-GAP-like repeat-containing protein [Paraflavitalea pollutisoli]|uniref:FG-GAP-like repeat-containing protein n=1 Tax=Paraflavitalea pollutisoli TaxID=3034143 RepID=UPI0023EAE4BB|nr:FG-GAP-like repeat-containing protein [Paraflavitalea sp. H1-2-19X]